MKWHHTGLSIRGQGFDSPMGRQNLDRWPRGLKRCSRKAKAGNTVREFESHSIRHRNLGS